MPQQELLFLILVLSAFSLFSARCRYTQTRTNILEARRKLLSRLGLAAQFWSMEGWKTVREIDETCTCSLLLVSSIPSSKFSCNVQVKVIQNQVLTLKAEASCSSVSGTTAGSRTDSSDTYNELSLQVQLPIDRERNVLRAGNSLLQDLQFSILLCTMYLPYIYHMYKYFQWLNGMACRGLPLMTFLCNLTISWLSMLAMLLTSIFALFSHKSFLNIQDKNLLEIIRLQINIMHDGYYILGYSYIHVLGE